MLENLAEFQSQAQKIDQLIADQEALRGLTLLS